MTTKCYDISGLGVRFAGLSAELAERFESPWSLFERPDLEQVVLDARITVEGAAVPDGIIGAESMRTIFAGASARFEMVGGKATIDDSGSFDVRLAPSGAATQFIALLNLSLAGLAWRTSRGAGAILHSAAIVLDDRAVVLVGPSGSGKSTWAQLATEAGAPSLGDDLVLLDGSRGRIEALSNPIRRRFGSIGPGRWPLGALLIPRHGSTASLGPANSMLLAARIVGNLPWVGETLSPTLSAFVDELVARVPAYTLTFAKDASFLKLLRDRL